VIPTRERPTLVVRAVQSALAQTVDDLEVVVVLDGGGAPTAFALAAIGDPRVRIETLTEGTGPGAARNAGVRGSRASIVAFLDDDDEWRPQKLEHQLAELHARKTPTILAARVIVRSPGCRDRTWPTRLPGRDERLCDYLLARRGLHWGEALVQTSTIVTEKQLLDRVPFREDLHRHEDLDWLLRAAEVTGAELVFARPEQTLAVWHVDEARPRASRRSDPLGSLEWIRSVRPLVTRRAYAAFVLAWVLPDARGGDRLRLLPRVLWESVRFGRPAPVDVVIAAGSLLVPARLRP
jgi:glycosyltransferase involved in cell wall biosynthesis